MSDGPRENWDSDSAAHEGGRLNTGEGTNEGEKALDDSEIADFQGAYNDELAEAVAAKIADLDSLDWVAMAEADGDYEFARFVRFLKRKNWNGDC